MSECITNAERLVEENHDLLLENVCRHEYEFVRNIYGDEINLAARCRSMWRCKKCGGLKFVAGFTTDFDFGSTFR